MKKLGILAMASVLTLGTFCTLGVVNSNSTKELNLTTELAGAKAISVKRAAATVATDAQYISSVVTQVEDSGDETYDLRFVALVSVNKSEEGVYTRPGTYGFHVEFTGTSVVNQDVEVKNYYNSISATVDGVTTWYANEDSGKYDGTSLDSIPMIGEEVIGDEYYSSKLVIALTVTNVTDLEAAFKVKPYASIEGQEIAYGAEKETTVGEHVEEKEVGYVLRVNGEIVTGKEVTSAGNSAAYTLSLKQGDKVVVSKDGKALTGGDYTGTEVTMAQAGNYNFYVNTKDVVYITRTLTIWTNDWASDCAAFYLYSWTANRGNAWTKMGVKGQCAENNGAHGDKYIVEVRHDTTGIIVCEMTKDADGWGNKKKQSSDVTIQTGVNEYIIYL